MDKETIQRRNISCFVFPVKGKSNTYLHIHYALFPTYVKVQNKIHTTLPFETGSSSKQHRGKFKFVPHREPTASSLQKTAVYCCQGIY